MQAIDPPSVLAPLPVRMTTQPNMVQASHRTIAMLLLIVGGGILLVISALVIGLAGVGVYAYRAQQVQVENQRIQQRETVEQLQQPAMGGRDSR